MPDPFDLLAASANSAMLVVTAAADDERAGCLVGFHSQSSIEPHRYSVWLSKANHTYRVALRASYLGVHFLTADDLVLAQLFGTRTGDEVDKFAGLEWAPGPEGLPLLDALPNRLTVRRTALLDEGGDHVCVVAEALEAAGGRFAPLRLADVTHLRPGHAADERST